MTTADPFVTGVAEGRGWAPWRGLGDQLGAVERAFNRARASGKATDDVRLRIFFVVALFAAAFIALAIAATNAALFSDSLRKHGELTPTRAARADLVDRNGEVLAMDLVRFGLYLRPAEITDKAGTRAAILAIAPHLSQTQLDYALTGRQPLRRGKTEPFDPAKEFYAGGGLTPAEKARLHDLALPGFDFQEEAGRLYPLGRTGAHLIGFASKDGIGMAGAEKAFDAPIRANAAEHGQQALSIDLRVQAALQDELQSAAVHFGVKDAVGMVVNVRTGEILGMASWPDFDPNAPGKADPATMVNHAANTVYEPGSVFKVFTVAMGLDTGIVDPKTVFDVCSPLVLPGQIIHDYDKGDCALPLWEVFTHSSNIGAAKMAIRVGGDNEASYFKSFGLFQRAPSELAESAHPLVPQRISVNATATMAFGQSISLSPLALATGMSAILDGGIYRPLTLRKLEPGQEPAPGRRVLKETTARTMLHLMRLNATNGTGRFADQIAPGYMVGGKTGTATKLVHGHYDKGKKNLASFAAVFPTAGGFDQDRYYVLVMMDEPNVLGETGGFTTGGAVSAPIAGRIIRRIAPFLNAPRFLNPPDEPPPGKNKDDVDPAIIEALDK
jgi:cell division protein FtsI (penicillin-binding protein 3)